MSRRAVARAAALAAGILFGIGLAISGMARPAKVLGFLDLAGDWDASLLFVMGAAIAVHLPTARWITRRPAPLLDVRFHLPTRKDIDLRLLLGAAVFGVGWGLAGFCPGPGLLGAASGALPALVFVAAMLIGMKVEQRALRPR